MELYGSLLNISGSVTASTFTGSFIGDGSGLTGIQASGVTGLNLSQISNGDATASITTSGFTVNKNTQIQGNLSVTGAIIANEYIVSSSVIYMTTSFASGSSAFGNDNNDVHQFTGSVQITGSISLNGQAIGTGKLDETTFQTYTSSNDGRVSSLETSSGSLNSFTSSINTTIKSKLDSDNVISGSVQVNISGTTGYDTFSSSVATTISGLTSTITSLSSSLTSSIGSLSSSIATTDLNQENRLNALETSSGSLNSFTSSIDTTIKSKLNADGVVSGSLQILNGSNLVSSSAQVTAYGFATTGSNLFKGTQTHSGSILPSVDNEYDLGSVTHQWRDVYISSGSLYIDGTKVISSTAQELQITTDSGQSIKILEGGTDSIILQTADGNVELKSNADGDILLDPTNGKIVLKGTIEVLNGQKIQSSVGGTPIVFANDIVVSGSIDITGTIEGINLTDFSSSVNTRLGNLESGAGSLNAFTASATTRLNSLETTTGSLNSYTSSNNTRLGVIEATTSSLNSYTSSNNSRLTTIESTTSSLNSYTSSNNITNTTQNDRLSSLETNSGSINSFTTSINGKISTIETSTSSLNTFTSSINTAIKSKLNADGVVSGSIQVNISGTTGYSDFSSSIATTDLNQTNRLNSIEGKTGSYATTGSNIFIGDQTITGSLFISQNLIVQGSSSLENITASAVSIGTNTIILNTDTPAFRYAGISVFDSGSTSVTASLFYDSLTNQWKFKHSDVGTNDASILLFGPLGNDIDNTPLLASNYLTKVEGTNDHGHHITSSNIFDNGSKVSINSNTEITGTFVATGTALVSGSSQISHDSTTGYVANRHIDHSAVTITAGNGLSGGGDITSTRTITLDTSSATFTTGVKSKMNTDGVISGSSQVVASLPSGTVSGSSQVLNGTGIFSGSAQLPSGLVSGSSQVLAGTTIHSGSFFNGITVVSGSAQISFNGITDKPALVSGSSQISFNTISDKPTLVSGSSQIAFGSITGVPSGLVSGSSQIDLTATTNYSSGIKTRLNAEGVVSGSAQITLSSTTGYGSVLNQAVLTSSSPTFGGLTNNGTYTQATTSTQPLTINGDSGDTNGLFRIQMDSVNDSFASGARTYLGDGGIDIFLGTGNSSYTPSNTYIALNHSGEISMGAGSATKHFTLSTSGNLTISGTIGASNFSGTSSGTNTGDQTLNSLGALSSNADSEQVVGVKDLYFNFGVGRVHSDPRWNESGYDADLGTLHIYSTTAAGANYGRAGIALYNGSAYQYITTKASTTGVFVNNTQVVTNSGTWSISVSGNAGTTSQRDFSGDISTSGMGRFTGWYTGNAATGLAAEIGISAGQAYLIAYNRQTSTYAAVNIESTGSTLRVSGSTVNVVTGALQQGGNQVLHAGNFGSYALPLAGGTMTGIITTVSSGTAINFLGQSDSFGYNGTSGQGTYIKGTSSTYVYGGGTFFDGATVRVLLHSGNFTSYAMSGAGFSANQNLSTSSTVTFGNLRVGSGGSTNGGVLNVTGGNDNQVNITHDSSWGLLLGYCNEASASGYHGPNHAAIINVRNASLHFGINNSSNVQISSGGHFHPSANNTYDCGTSSLAWRNVYTNDLHLSNMNKPEGNDVDGTNGNWTIQEGSENLYIINNNNGKKFKISLEEII